MDVLRCALITGAVSGIGRACAIAFAVEGAAGVALLDVNHDSLVAVKSEVEQRWAKQQNRTPCRVDTYTVDVTDEDQVNQTVEKVAQEFGRIDYVVNAAGIAIKQAGDAVYAEMEDWQRIVNVNLTGTFLVLRAAARIMLKQEPLLSRLDGRSLHRGSIVNLASILGLVGGSLATAYTATKHGVVGLTRTASED